MLYNISFVWADVWQEEGAGVNGTHRRPKLDFQMKMLINNFSLQHSWSQEWAGVCKTIKISRPDGNGGDLSCYLRKELALVQYTTSWERMHNSRVCCWRRGKCHPNKMVCLVKKTLSCHQNPFYKIDVEFIVRPQQSESLWWVQILKPTISDHSYSKLSLLRWILPFLLVIWY